MNNTVGRQAKRAFPIVSSAPDDLQAKVADGADVSSEAKIQGESLRLKASHSFWPEQ